AESASASGCLEREARDLHVVAVLLLRLRFGEPDLRDLGMRVHDVRYDVVVHRRILAQDRVDRYLALRRRDVRELRRPRVADAVADRPYALDARAHALV